MAQGDNNTTQAPLFLQNMAKTLTALNQAITAMSSRINAMEREFDMSQTSESRSDTTDSRSDVSSIRSPAPISPISSQARLNGGFFYESLLCVSAIEGDKSFRIIMARKDLSGVHVDHHKPATVSVSALK